MGHCEMLLAVAGLDPKALEERTRLLASGDWSTLPAADRAGFLLARKFSKEPSAISQADVDVLVSHFGPARALDVIWWASRCHYMTRVADAFQIPLERENVFVGVVPGPGDKEQAKPPEDQAKPPEEQPKPLEEQPKPPEEQAKKP